MHDQARQKWKQDFLWTPNGPKENQAEGKFQPTVNDEKL